jgi:hypothetical protein
MTPAQIKEQAKHVQTMLRKTISGINYTIMGVCLYEDAPLTLVTGDGMFLAKFLVQDEQWIPVKVASSEKGYPNIGFVWDLFLPESRTSIHYTEVHKCLVAYLDNPAQAERRIAGAVVRDEDPHVRPAHQAADAGQIHGWFAEHRAEKIREQEVDYYEARNWIVSVKYGLRRGQSMVCAEAMTKKAQRFVESNQDVFTDPSMFINSTAEGIAEKLELYTRSFE